MLRSLHGCEGAPERAREGAWAGRGRAEVVAGLQPVGEHVLGDGPPASLHPQTLFTNPSVFSLARWPAGKCQGSHPLLLLLGHWACSLFSFGWLGTSLFALLFGQGARFSQLHWASSLFPAGAPCPVPPHVLGVLHTHTVHLLLPAPVRIW